MRMHHRLVTSAAIAIGIVSSTLAADVETLEPARPDEQKIARQCLDDLEAFSQRLAESGFGVLPPGAYGLTAPTGYYGIAGTPRAQIQALRGAAQVFAVQGDEESCQRVLREMRAIFEAHQELVGPEADDPEARTAWRRAHLANAKPVTAMRRLMRADVVIGAEVRNPQDEKLGVIEDVVLDPSDGSIVYVLVGHGGFLGFGRQLVALRWQDLRATTDHEIFVLDVAESVITDAPAVDAENFAQTADPSWRQELDQFWDERLKG